MHFAGDGVDVPRLVEYCKEKKINNVAFSGRYLKENEDDIVSTSDFVNILLPQHVYSKQWQIVFIWQY